jgi:hypothetical protein
MDGRGGAPDAERQDPSTYLHGSDIHLDWCDDGYQKELEEGKWSPDDREVRELLERSERRSGNQARRRTSLIGWLTRNR